MDDLITFTRSKRGGCFEFTTDRSYTGLDTSEGKLPVIPVACHFLVMISHFLKDLTLFSPYLVFNSLIRLLSLFVYIMNKTGTAVNKVKPLLKS